MKLLHERVVAPEAQTRTNQAKPTALQPTLTPINVRQISFAREMKLCIELSSSKQEVAIPGICQGYKAVSLSLSR